MKESQLNDANESSGVSEDGSSKRSTKKKKVSFKFGLETSDDAHIVKKEPNTTFDPPVSIIKKECLTRAIHPIIAPSRLKVLTLPLDDLNPNKIDKLNSVTFKSKFVKSKEASKENATSNEDDQSDAEDENDVCRTDSDDADSDESSHSKNDENNAHDEDNTKGVSFQFPKRSAHSSRVIKPNKKFTDDAKSANTKNGFGKKRTTKNDNEIDASEANKNEGRSQDVSQLKLNNILNKHTQCA